MEGGPPCVKGNRSVKRRGTRKIKFWDINDLYGTSILINRKTCCF